MTEIVSVTPGKGNYYIGATETKIKVGTKVDEMVDERAKTLFKLIDSDNDEVISNAEMDEAVEIYERLKVPKGKINDAADKNFLIMFGAGLIGLLTAMSVPILSKKTIKTPDLSLSLFGGAGYLAGSRIAGAINCNISRKKADKAYEESLGEYKDHPLAKYTYEKYERPSALLGMMNDLHVNNMNDSYIWYLRNK